MARVPLSTKGGEPPSERGRGCEPTKLTACVSAELAVNSASDSGAARAGRTRGHWAAQPGWRQRQAQWWPHLSLRAGTLVVVVCV